MQTGAIIPIPEPGASMRESASYRGIALSSVINKILGLNLLHLQSDHLLTSHTQFEFTRPSTNMCTFVLKKH
jgi:hypothetical protein